MYMVPLQPQNERKRLCLQLVLEKSNNSNQVHDHRVRDQILLS